MAEEPLVSIICTAFNQEKYIAQTLEGFVTQRTSFPFEVIIHDDASTDGTADIIHSYEKKYPEIIKPIYQTENQYSKGVPIGARFMYPKARGKYIAECEGDDYWCATDKLQKQVEKLEKEDGCGLVYTKARMYFQNEERFAGEIGEDFVSYERMFVKGNVIPTLTTCFKKELLFKYHEEINPSDKNWLMGDLPMWLWFLKNTQVCFIPEVTAVYRVLGESASHSSDVEKQRRFQESGKSIRRFYADYFKEDVLFSEYQRFNEYCDAVDAGKIWKSLVCAHGISFNYLSLKERLVNTLKFSNLGKFLRKIYRTRKKHEK